MSAEDLTLNIAVNMGRLARWADEGKEARVKQFLQETEGYIEKLELAPKSQRFIPTFNAFVGKFKELKGNLKLDKYWAEDALTWANILTHRAKLA